MHVAESMIDSSISGITGNRVQGGAGPRRVYIRTCPCERSDFLTRGSIMQGNPEDWVPTNMTIDYLDKVPCSAGHKNCKCCSGSGVQRDYKGIRVRCPACAGSGDWDYPKITW